MQIKELKSEISDNSSLKSTLEEENLNLNAELYQASLNPFTRNTVIKYYLPESVSKAFIYIYNLAEQQIKGIQIHDRGESSITIYGSDFNAGMYKYALVANSQIVGTETMILTE